MDPYKALHVSLNPDGSLTRQAVYPLSQPTGEEGQAVDNSTYVVVSKDITFRHMHKTWLRVFLPKQQPAAAAIQKLPILLYFHGGGFILLSASSTPLHNVCARMAAELPALVLSVEYRLAPEHRLPAAYEDAVDALLWVRAQARDPASADPWLKDHADFSQCLLMGNSAGGNIAYHAGLRALRLDLAPLKLSGLILDQPFFGGVERTESEARMVADPVVPLAVADLLWELSLPQGADRDHEYSKPKGEVWGLPRCLVSGCTGDPLVDRQKDLIRVLERAGVNVVAKVDEGGYHGAELFDSVWSKKFLNDVKGFIYA